MVMQIFHDPCGNVRSCISLLTQAFLHDLAVRCCHMDPADAHVDHAKIGDPADR